MCERGREAAGGRAPGGVRPRDRPGSRSGPGGEPDEVRVREGFSVQVLVCCPGAGAGFGSGCKS